MKCLEREQLFAFAHGMLETRQAAEVRGHIAGCAVCQEVVREYLRLDSTLDEWKPVEPSAAFDARVRQAVEMQSKARDSSLWGGLFALTWARWLAPASLAVIVGVVALGLYRSHTIPGPAAPQSREARLSPAATQAPQTSAGAANQVVGEKKAGPLPETLPIEQKLRSPRANPQAATELAKELAEAQNAVVGGAAQGAARAAGSSHAPYIEPALSEAKGGNSGMALRAAAPSAPPVETRSDFLARAEGEPQTTAAPSKSAASFGALGLKSKEEQNRPQRVLPAAQSVSVSAEAQPQPTPAPPAPESVAKAQSGAAMGATARQMTATPEVTTTTAKSFSSGKGLALRSRSSHPATPPPPGLLESFLKQHPDAVLNKKLVGTLEGREGTKATFTAIVASDPADASSKAKGLVVDLEGNDRTATVYLDDDRDEETGQDSLRDFQEDLGRDAEKDKVLEYFRKLGDADRDWGTNLNALNRSGGSPRFCCPRYTVINVGWYKHGEDLGVVIVSFNPDVEFYFPGSEVPQVVKMIADGRAFLDAN